MIGDTNIDEETTKYLNAAYVSGKVIDSVKSKRTEIMPPAIKEKCPYCMLSEPGTFDHYLGKGNFQSILYYLKIWSHVVQNAIVRREKSFYREMGIEPLYHFISISFLKGHFL